jgi:CelD/BcsL family acetyltransferase involved in cellulose biosynthesis
LLRLPLPAGWRTEIADGEPSPVLALPAARPGTLPIPRRMADNIRHGRTRAARAGVLAYELADAGSIPALLAALVRLHTRRWSLRGLPGVLGDASVAAALGEATPLLHAAGLLRLHGLRLDGELIAVLYCLADAAGAAARHCYYYIGGFDPRCAAFSPGTLLIAQAIESAAAEGAAAFDFLRGGEAYKYRWGAVDQPMRTLRAWHDAPDRANHG